MSNKSVRLQISTALNSMFCQSVSPETFDYTRVHTRGTLYDNVDSTSPRCVANYIAYARSYIDGRSAEPDTGNCDFTRFCEKKKIGKKKRKRLSVRVTTVGRQRKTRGEQILRGQRIPYSRRAYGVLSPRTRKRLRRVTPSGPPPPSPQPPHVRLILTAIAWRRCESRATRTVLTNIKTEFQTTRNEVTRRSQ